MENDIGLDGVLFDQGLPFDIDYDLQVSDNGVLDIHAGITVNGFDEVLVIKPFYEITEFVLENSNSDYSELYSISNELLREAEKLRELAQRIEDSTANVSDLFDVEYDPT
tara:strand:- start:282 stop:611 length:330 start_codon:yes stop_codon:yes gene_type:complete